MKFKTARDRTTEKTKLLGALALARKAGKLKPGADAAEEALKKGAPLAVVTSDVSERTLRNMKAASDGKVLAIPLTQYEVYAGTGARFVAAAVLDENFAKLIRTSLNEEA